MRLVTLVYLRRGTNTFTTGRCQFVSYNEVAQTLARFHLDAHISDVSSDSNECGCCRHTSLHQLPVESRDEGTCEWDDAWDRIYQWPYIIYIYIWSSLLTVFILLTLCLFCWCVYLYLTAHIFCLTAHTHTHTVLLPPGGHTLKRFSCWQNRIFCSNFYSNISTLYNPKEYKTLLHCLNIYSFWNMTNFTLPIHD